MKLAIINYGSGNLRSVARAFERAASDCGAATQIVVTDDPAQVSQADYVVLPGVGAFGDCARGLNAVAGMREALEMAVREKRRPFLGICVGMQLMADRGLEHGVHAGLGWIGGEVQLLQRDDPAIKIPHMGWNVLVLAAGIAHPVLKGFETPRDCYFLHSYHFLAKTPSDVLASTEYGGTIAAAIGHENLLGVQFHPEKSQAAGLRLLGNFLQWQP